MPDLAIRVYQASDEKDVIDLWVSCDLVVPWNNPKTDIERKLTQNPELFFVGEKDGKLLATCMAGYDGHRGWVYYLAVHSGHRKDGIATALMQHAEESLKAIGCPKIELMVRSKNKGVIGFYDSIGYKEEPVVVLSKRLIEDIELE